MYFTSNLITTEFKKWYKMIVHIIPLSKLNGASTHVCTKFT